MTGYTHIINGKPATSPRTLEVINPATQKIITEVPVATKEQLDEAIDSARAALPVWFSKSEDERAEALNQIASIIENNLEDYKRILTSEQGKCLNDAEAELRGAILWIREMAKLRLPDNVIVDNEHIRITERRVPIGVCAGIVPWNFPIMLWAWKLAPALLAGNTFIVKPSPFTPLTTLRIFRDIQSAVPPGVLSTINGDDSLGPLITTHPGVDMISFTGSNETGKKVMSSASAGLKRLTLELGGNDPAIILPDVDPVEIAPKIFEAALVNNGQTCFAAKRLYIHERVYDQFRDELVKHAKTVKTGNGMDSDTRLGPVQNLLQYKKIVTFFEDAHANGYQFALGGSINPNPTDGLFIPVSFVDNPPESSKIVREEPFGPIVPLLKWSDEADVIKRANDTKYGLSATIWGKDLDAIERIAKQIQAGTVCSNDFCTANPLTAFGGHKESGIGVESGIHGLLGYTNIQTLMLKKRPVSE